MGTGGYAAIPIVGDEQDAVNALVHGDRTNLLVATGEIRISDDTLAWRTNATGAIVSGLKQLQSYDDAGPAMWLVRKIEKVSNAS